MHEIILRLKRENERLTKERDEEKRHSETAWKQVDLWLEENGRLRAELDRFKTSHQLMRNYLLEHRETTPYELYQEQITNVLQESESILKKEGRY